MTEDVSSDPIALICVKYTSRSLINGDLGALQTLRSSCVRKNVLRGISGALYYDNRRFFQILEGNRADVEALLRDIGADARHADMRILESGPIAKRRFGEWSMKFVSGLSADPPVDMTQDSFAEAGQDLIDRMSVFLLKA